MLGGASLTPFALKGTGTALLDAYGGLERLDLEDGETYTLDNEHLVAWEDGVDSSTQRVGGLVDRSNRSYWATVSPRRRGS